MGGYPRAARDARIKCMECNAPVTETVDGGYACVDCGRNPLANRSSGGASSTDATTVDETTVEETTVDQPAGEDGSPAEDDSGAPLDVGH